jgi:hypothetical protein
VGAAGACALVNRNLNPSHAHMRGIDALRQSAVRRELAKLCLHTVFFLFSWYFSLLKGLVICLILYDSLFLYLIGYKSGAYWLMGLLR